MKRLLALLLALLLGGLVALPVGGEGYPLPEGVTVTAPQALLMSLGAEPAQDVVLLARGADTRRDPGASLRVLVGLYAIREIRARSLDMDTASGSFTRTEQNLIGGTGLAVAGIKVGDVWTLRDLLTVAMMDSAADVTVTLAATLSGDVNRFLEGMNALAAEMGCADTHAANITGLDNPAQYTTPRDLYRIARAAMAYPELTYMMGLTSHAVQPLQGAAQTRSNVCPMMRRGTEVYYENALFGRTGFTEGGGRCMVSAARSGGYEYLAVVMGSKGEDGRDLATAHVRDSVKLFGWALKSFAYRTLVQKDQPIAQVEITLAWGMDTLPLVAGESFSTVVDKSLDIGTVRLVPLPDAVSVQAPIEKGAVLGRAEVYIQLDQKLGEVTLVAARGVERSELLAFWRTARGVLGNKWLYIGLAGLLLLIGLYALASVVMNKGKRKGRG